MNIDIIQVRTRKTMIKETLREKCPNTEFFSGPYFPAFGLNTERYSVFSPSAWKYGPEKTLYLGSGIETYSER